MTTQSPANRIGRSFGRLTIVSTAPRVVTASGHRITKFRCVCECGTETVVAWSNLRSGGARSCGCLQREITSARVKTHGKAAYGKRTRGYRAWVHMKSRCNNPNDNVYRLYGARGITVCDRWQTFENFIADMGEPPIGRSLDRIDNDGPYSPENCRWATQSEQARNQRGNRPITINGVTKCMIDWSESVGIKYGTLISRIGRGWDEQRAVMEQVK